MPPSKDLTARMRLNVAARTDSKDDASSGSSGVCSIDPAATQWPTAQIEQQLQLNAKQREALGQLKKAFGETAANIKQACRDEASVAPMERLRVMQGTLWAIHDALLQLRGPLAKFYEQLSDEQRQKFAAPPSTQADPRSMSPGAIARLCGAPPATQRQAQQAEQQLNLNKPHVPVVVRGEVAVARHRREREVAAVAVIAQVEHPRETGRGVALLVPEAVRALGLHQVGDAAPHGRLAGVA